MFKLFKKKEEVDISNMSVEDVYKMAFDNEEYYKNNTKNMGDFVYEGYVIITGCDDKSFEWRERVKALHSKNIPYIYWHLVFNLVGYPNNERVLKNDNESLHDFYNLFYKRSKSCFRRYMKKGYSIKRLE